MGKRGFARLSSVRSKKKHCSSPPSTPTNSPPLSRGAQFRGSVPVGLGDTGISVAPADQPPVVWGGIVLVSEYPPVCCISVGGGLVAGLTKPS